MVNQNNRIFIMIKKGSTDFRHASIFRGRGALINHLNAVTGWYKYYLDDYDILEITSVNVKKPIEDFKTMDLKVEKEKDEKGPQIVKEISCGDGYTLNATDSNTHNTKYTNWP